MITKEKLNEIRKNFPIGAKIKLHSMKGEPQMPKGLIGEVTLIDAIGQVHVKWDNGSSLALSVDEDDFQVVKTIKIILVKPYKKAEIVEIVDELKYLQEIVGGHIEALTLPDGAIIIMNEEGRLLRLPLNRPIMDENGKNRSPIIRGTFFITYAVPGSDSFSSLPDNLIEKYFSMFEEPKMFISENGKIIITDFKE